MSLTGSFSVPFIFLLFCFHVPSLWFQMSFHFHSFSFHVPFAFFRLHFICFSFPLFNFIWISATFTSFSFNCNCWVPFVSSFMLFLLPLRKWRKHTHIYIYSRYSICEIYWKRVRVFTGARFLVEGSLEVKFPTTWTDEKQRWEQSEKRRGEERRSKMRKSQKKEDPGARKGRKVTKHRVFRWFVAPEGRKVGSLKQRVRSQLAKWEIKNCTPLWREAHLQVKKLKHLTFGPLLEVEMSKKCTPLWREAHFDVKMDKAHCTPLRREAHFEVNMLKKQHVRTTFWRSDVVLCGRRKGLCTCQKWVKREGFVAVSKTMAGVAGVGHLKRIWQDTFSVACAAQETCSSDMLGGPGADFLRGVAIWNIRSSRLLRWFAWQVQHFVWPHDLASLFRGRRSTLDRWNRKVAKRIGRRPSALHSTFHFWRKSRRIASFLMLPASKIEKVSQNCSILDVVKFKKWGRLAKIVALLMLSSSKTAAVSQNSFVFKLADRQIDR